MPYTYKKVGDKQCVYKKDSGAKVGCTNGSIKKYLAALYANADESVTEANNLKGGKADKLSLKQIADKFGVSIETIKSQIQKGVDVEMEHTDNKEKAREIATDHVSEFPDYYDRLIKMEKKAEKQTKKLEVKENAKPLIKRLLRENLDNNNKLSDVSSYMVPASIGYRGIYGSRYEIPAYRMFKSNKPYYVDYNGISTMRILIGRDKIENVVEIVIQIGDVKLGDNGISIKFIDEKIEEIKTDISNVLKQSGPPNEKDLERARKVYSKYKDLPVNEFVIEFFLANFELINKRWFAKMLLQKGKITLNYLVNVSRQLI